MADDRHDSLLTLTSEIVSAHVANNQVETGELPGLVNAVYTALSGLGEPEPAPQEEKPKGAVSVRKSLASPDFIISMIDGRGYKALTRHLRTHGLDPDGYRARFGLPADYPMVSKTYSEARSAMAKAIGLGRKAGTAAGKAAAEVGDAIVDAEHLVEAAVEPRRGRKPNALGSAIASAKAHLGGKRASTPSA